MTPSYEYIAGFLDADGHIGIVKSTPAHSAPQYWVRMVMYSQNLSALQAISEVVGGYVLSAPTKNGVGVGCYRLVVKPSQAIPALEKIMPHMIIKKQQVDLAFRLHATISRHSYHGRSKTAGILRTPGHITEEREAMYVEMKRLNHQDSMEYRKIWVNSEEAPEGVTLSQAVEGNGSTEGATTSSVSPNNNLSQERPASIATGRHSLDSTVLVH